jgi:uncharacterized protein (UPF0335 family)
MKWGLPTSKKATFVPTQSLHTSKALRRHVAVPCESTAARNRYRNHHGGALALHAATPKAITAFEKSGQAPKVPRVHHATEGGPAAAPGDDRLYHPELGKPRGPTLTDWLGLCGHFRDLIQQRGTMSDISIPGGRIRSFVERIEHLDTELQELNESKKEVFAEAKGEGFDVKILKEIIKLRKQDKDERDERDTLLDMYMRAMETAGPEAVAKAA